MKYVKSLRDNPVFPLILVVAIIILSFVVGKFADILDFKRDWPLILASGAAIITIFGGVLLVLHRDYSSEFEGVKSRYESQFNLQIEKLERIVNEYRPSFDWLLTENQLFKFELKFGIENRNCGKQIWIISSTLKNDIAHSGDIDPLFRDTDPL
jgi:hypothetical protein